MCSMPEQGATDLQAKPAQPEQGSHELEVPLVRLNNTTPTNSAQETGTAAGTVLAKKGFLENLPLNCIQLILDSQPDDLHRKIAHLMLFCSSKFVASRLLELALNVTIVLYRGSNFTPDQAQARRQIITDFLGVRPAFQVKLGPEGYPRFPQSLADRVTSLELDDKGTQTAYTLPWTAMTSLHTIRFMYYKQDYSFCILDMAEVRGLCEALEAGQLQQLRTLHLPLYRSIQELDRFVQAVGPQLEELTCSCGDLVMKVGQLVVLKRITLDSCCLTESMMQQLAEHPTLRHVTFKHSEIQGDHSLRSCSWETLSVHDVDLCMLLRLPLASVQHIYLPHGISCRNTNSMQDMKSVLAQYGHKVACVPCQQYGDGEKQYGAFRLADPCELMASLIAPMKDVKELIVMSSFDICVVSWLWHALPASVSIIRIQGQIHGNASLLWQGLPQHVTNVELVV